MKNQVIDFAWFVVSFDESLNEAKQTSEMDICLRFWNKENNQVEDSYWDSKFLEQTNHEHILDSVHEDLKVFDMAEMIELLMAGPNVNLKLLKKLKEQRNKLGSPGLIDFDRCNLHIVHSAFKSGVRQVDEFEKNYYSRASSF